eukprot:scaffold305713_cov31-Tisochrysis_lutea.AAC.2
MSVWCVRRASNGCAACARSHRQTVASYEADIKTEGACGDQRVQLTALSCAASIATGLSSERTSQRATSRSAPQLAKACGSYLAQSTARTSARSCAAIMGSGPALGSHILTEPSAEAESSWSAWCGDQATPCTASACPASVISEAARSGAQSLSVQSHEHEANVPLCTRFHPTPAASAECSRKAAIGRFPGSTSECSLSAPSPLAETRISAEVSDHPQSKSPSFVSNAQRGRSSNPPRERGSGG